MCFDLKLLSATFRKTAVLCSTQIISSKQASFRSSYLGLLERSAIIIIDIGCGYKGCSNFNQRRLRWGFIFNPRLQERPPIKFESYVRYIHTYIKPPYKPPHLLYIILITTHNIYLLLVWESIQILHTLLLYIYYYSIKFHAVLSHAICF